MEPGRESPLLSRPGDDQFVSPTYPPSHSPIFTGSASSALLDQLDRTRSAQPAEDVLKLLFVFVWSARGLKLLAAGSMRNFLHDGPIRVRTDADGMDRNSLFHRTLRLIAAILHGGGAAIADPRAGFVDVRDTVR